MANTSLTPLWEENLLFFMLRNGIFCLAVSIHITNSSNESHMHRFYSDYCQGAARASYSLTDRDSKELCRAARAHHTIPVKSRAAPPLGIRHLTVDRDGTGCGPKVGGVHSQTGQGCRTLEAGLAASFLGQDLVLLGMLRQWAG